MGVIRKYQRYNIGYFFAIHVLVFSNAGRSYTQPFNMTAVHPTYKNWKTHLGITSMNFSKYTYSGMNFVGAGVEYTPKKWSFKAFWWTFEKSH